MELDSGELVHYGCVCAARNTGKTQPAIKREISEHAAVKLNAAQVEFNAHPARLAYEVKMSQSRKAGLVGVAFMNANAVEREACAAAATEIAARHGVPSYKL